MLKAEAKTKPKILKPKSKFWDSPNYDLKQNSLKQHNTIPQCRPSAEPSSTWLEWVTMSVLCSGKLW